MIYDLICATFCFYLSIAIRFGSIVPPEATYKNLFTYIVVITIAQFSTFYFFGLYKGIWRFSSTPDLVRVIKGSSAAVLFSLLSIFLINRLEGVPRSSFIIDWALLVLSLGGGRFIYRIWADNYTFKKYSKDADKILIAGAGDAGVQLLREIKNSMNSRYDVVGFLDDNLDIKGKKIHNVPIHGTTSDIDNVIRFTGANKVFIAIPSANSEQIRKIVEATKEPVEFKILPKMSDIIDGNVHISQLRNLKLEDLLGRESINLDINTISKMLTEKIILISGAGGSIGSEICRQVANFKPRYLVALEQNEFNLYSLQQEIQQKYPEVNFIPIIADVRNPQRVSNILKRYSPDVVFHAAAYKHVPMMEANCYEAIRTNVYGTKVMATACVEHKIKKFVMVSTDKAVNPTNVMGASKRIAELVCQNIQKKSEYTKFLTVRFGNVLGSSGSVIPLFQKQIEEGGPITITHKNITRYFMSIPEASQLVMQAGAIGNGGEIFVLDMGTPVRILDLAKQMISLAGLKPEVDIPIRFVGLRPGEKLFEELLMDEEHTLPTLHPKVRVAKATNNISDYNERMTQLLSLTSEADVAIFKTIMKKLVPEFLSPEEHLEQTEKNNPDFQ